MGTLELVSSIIGGLSVLGGGIGWLLNHQARITGTESKVQALESRVNESFEEIEKAEARQTQSLSHALTNQDRRNDEFLRQFENINIKLDRILIETRQGPQR